MKKAWFSIVALASVLFFFTSPAFAGYLVSDAGVESANGLYCNAGKEKCGHEFQAAIYEKSGTDLAIWFSEFPTPTWVMGRLWCSEGGYSAIEYYAGGNGSSLPPLSGWIATNPIYGAPPTLSIEPCEQKPEPVSVPAMSRWGLLVFAIMVGVSYFLIIRRRKRTR